MLKVKHLFFVATLGMFALLIPAGCAMDATGQTETASEPTADPSESIDEGTEGQSLAAGGKWRIYDAELCSVMCQGNPFGCGCVDIPRCTVRPTQGRPCPTLGKFCFVQVSNMGQTYRCQ